MSLIVNWLNLKSSMPINDLFSAMGHKSCCGIFGEPSYTQVLWRLSVPQSDKTHLFESRKCLGGTVLLYIWIELFANVWTVLSLPIITDYLETFPILYANWFTLLNLIIFLSYFIINKPFFHCYLFVEVWHSKEEEDYVRRAGPVIVYCPHLLLLCRPSLPA